ncbi:MAG: tetratricopeptide repeat protein [Spirochaetales bacterium]|nr:tetratricopeptide repeat protein [Spirochaetales bacterium]
MFILSLSANSDSYLEQGEEYFMSNRPEEALPLLEVALNADPGNEKIYLYLGIVYEQLNQRDKAIAVLQRGVKIATRYKGKFYFNIGNNFFYKNQNTLAEEMYSQAITTNPAYADAYLNRANTRLRQENQEGALTDYRVYLSLSPNAPQREDIEALIEILSRWIQDTEARRLAEEAERKALEERQKALLADVLNTLSNAGEDTENLSADTGEIEYETEEFDIDD